MAFYDEKTPAAIDFVLAELQGPVVVPGFPEVAGITITFQFKALVCISEVVTGLMQAAALPGILEPRVLAHQALAGAEHGEEPASEGLAQHIAPFGVLPVIPRSGAAQGRLRGESWMKASSICPRSSS